ncbi:hypothetical protein Ahy_A02g005750 isoform B [Arachis hypogaea]|uniref:Uncharacterized protein n=1 Tax=Arachis hypogaea TaxID=3818 RepID=A0A445E875_ARAHY|nr:hypothetical protein Ahy_A02g005750 isoform B [Arachis hypogaea]
MAATLVGGAVLSSIFNVVFDRMSSPEFANWIKGKKLTQNLLERLKTNLYAVQAFLNDAEQKQIKERAVKDWLDSLKDAMYVADDLLDEVFTKAATQKDPGTFFSRFLNLQDREIANRTEEIIDRIESIVKQKDTLGLREIPKENIIKHTRTFLEFNLKSWIPFNMENAPCILLSHLKYLRALSFNSFPLELVPDSIGELIHLRYLDLSWTDIVALPESLGNLYNLQTLKLYSCSNLKMLPVGMKDLINLRHLDVRDTPLHEMPKSMSKLKNLQFLSDYVVGKREENKITELGALANLQLSISIAKLENVVNSSEASMARMSDKDGISSLILRWSSDKDENTADSQIERDILDKLRPHTNLKELYIYGYRGTTFPDWVGHSSYYSITEITLGDFSLGGCRNCCMLPSLGQLPSLKHLSISDFESLESVGAELYFNQNGESCLETPPFPMLETLSFYSMPCWKEWRSLEFNAFPRLRELTIIRCPMLRGDLPSQLPSLQSLQIFNCKQLSCCVPRAPSITNLSISGKHLVESGVEAITHMQLSCLTSLRISGYSSHIWFPVSAIPASLQKLTIQDCRELEFEMDGQHHSLQILSIESSCDSLTSFSLLDAFPNLVRVYISKCEKMECIVVSRSLSSLRDLNIIECRSLKSVSTLWMAAPQLEHLTLRECPEIELSATGDPNRSLRSLEFSYSEKLVSSALFVNSQFHGLTSLCIWGECESVKCLTKEGWLPASLESLTLLSMKSVETLECKGLAHLTSLQKLTIAECPKLENIDGEKLPVSLIQLFINESPLLAKQCEMKDPQLWPKVSHIPAIQVDYRWIWSAVKVLLLMHQDYSIIAWSWEMMTLGASSKLDSEIPFEYSATMWSESQGDNFCGQGLAFAFDSCNHVQSLKYARVAFLVVS